MPEKIFANLANVADRSHRRIDEVIAEKIERDFAIDADELAKQISICLDKEILELAEITMLSAEDERVSFLLAKQNEENLSAEEEKQMRQLMDASRLTTLKRLTLCAKSHGAV